MNVYDFDETVLKGDSEDYFYKYVFKRYPESYKYKDDFVNKRNEYKSGLISSEEMYDFCYGIILNYVNDLDSFLEEFWDEHQKYIKEWYLKQHKDDDVVISATPRFILVPIMKRLNIKYLIASELDVKTKKTIGKLCYRNQKVIRFNELYPNVIPDKFYSDSDSDVYMAKIAKEAFKVLDDKILPWNF